MRRAPLRTLLVLVLVTAGAATAATPPPTIQARAWILVNPATGEVLASRNPDTRLPMASTTKLMTAIVTMERSGLDRLLTVPSGLPGGSSAALVPGERISMRTAMTGLLIGSGNDASIAIADAVGGGSETRFVTYMNAEAAAMGLRNTHFANPHGLDAAGHHSTVRDLVKMGQRAREFPFIRQTVAKRVTTIPGPGGRGTRRLESENDLLSIDREADGVKTGHTAGAGYALVAHATRRANRTEMYLALIGSPNRSQRAQDARLMLNWGLAQYVRVTPLTAKQVILRVPVRDRPGLTVPLTVDAPFATTVRLGTRLKRTIVAPVEISAPATAGTPVGTVRIVARGRVVGTRKLVVGEAVDAPSVMERIRSGWGRVL